MQRGAWLNPKQLMQRSVQVLLVTHLYDNQADTFLPVADMPSNLPQQIRAALQALQQISTGSAFVLRFNVCLEAACTT